MSDSLRNADRNEAKELLGMLAKGQVREFHIAGARFKGYFDIIAREGSDVAWEIHQENLLTDYGRQSYAYNFGIHNNVSLGTSPVSDTPVVQRNLLASQAWYDINFVNGPTVSYDGSSSSKTFSNNYASGSTRNIGCVWIASNGSLPNFYGAVAGVLAYSLITPIRQQTSSQTLELAYKLTLSIVS